MLQRAAPLLGKEGACRKVLEGKDEKEKEEEEKVGEEKRKKNIRRVYSSFLDVGKAFARLVHSGLFFKMLEKNFPISFAQIMISWHNGLQCRVNWNNTYSEWFQISAGVRQGSILSPDLYCLYVDEIIEIL